jgi:MFS family permease
MDAVGRKRTLLVANTPFIVGWLLLFLAPKPAPVGLLYLGRLLNGFGGGMVSSSLLLSPLLLPFRTSPSSHLSYFLKEMDWDCAVATLCRFTTLQL